MTERTKSALVKFTNLVATAIAHQENGKDVAWREIVGAQEELEHAIESEPNSPNASEHNPRKRLVKRNHLSELKGPGEYVRVSNGVVLTCPYCGIAMACDHQVVNEDPLTLKPSIVGPGLDPYVIHCGHHFFVTNGEVVSEQ